VRLSVGALTAVLLIYYFGFVGRDDNRKEQTAPAS
jgi:hypothetical protein